MKGQKNNYLHSIDFLRGFTALVVVIYHFINHEDANGDLLAADNWAVQSSSVLPSIVFIFFSLSGFVIAMSMDKNQFKLKSIGGFLARRWVRIEIPYIASIAVYLSISLVWLYKAGEPLFIDPLRILHHLVYTIPFTHFTWYNEVYWTLGLEFQFYILIALIFPVIASKNLWIRYSSLILFAAIAFLLPDNRLIFRYAPMFVVGIATYFNWHSGEKKHPAIWIVLMFCLVQIGYLFDIYAALYIAASLAVMHMTIPKSNYITKLGKMGYSLYLIHGAAGGSLLYFLGQYNASPYYSSFIIAVAIIFSIVVSYVFYRVIELPSIRGAKRINFGTKIKSKNNE